MARFLVTVERTIVQWTDVEVEADSKAEARELALADAKDAIDWQDIDETGDDLEVTETQYAGPSDGEYAEPEL